MVLDYYLHLSQNMLLQTNKNGNLHQINSSKVRKKLNVFGIYLHVVFQESSFNSN